MLDQPLDSRSATGCSAAWLARHVRDVEAGSSNLPIPTSYDLKSRPPTGGRDSRVAVLLLVPPRRQPAPRVSAAGVAGLDDDLVVVVGAGLARADAVMHAEATRGEASGPGWSHSDDQEVWLRVGVRGSVTWAIGTNWNRFGSRTAGSPTREPSAFGLVLDTGPRARDWLLRQPIAVSSNTAASQQVSSNSNWIGLLRLTARTATKPVQLLSAEVRGVPDGLEVCEVDVHEPSRQVGDRAGELAPVLTGISSPTRSPTRRRTRSLPQATGAGSLSVAGRVAFVPFAPNRT